MSIGQLLPQNLTGSLPLLSQSQPDALAAAVELDHGHKRGNAKAKGAANTTGAGKGAANAGNAVTSTPGKGSAGADNVLAGISGNNPMLANLFNMMGMMMQMMSMMMGMMMNMFNGGSPTPPPVPTPSPAPPVSPSPLPIMPPIIIPIPPTPTSIPPAPPGGVMLPPPAPAPATPTPFIQTKTGPSPSAAPAKTTPLDLNYAALTEAQKTSVSGLTETERAIIHIWGRQMASTGFEDGGILNTILNNAAKGTTDPTVLTNPTEVALAKQFVAEDTAKYGGVTGKSLDEAFFAVFKKMSGEDLSTRYANSPVRFANGRLAELPTDSTNSPTFEAKMEAQNGLNSLENAILIEWGHDPLFGGNGKITGTILPYTLLSKNELDPSLNKNDVTTLIKGDLMADGQLDGRTLKDGFLDLTDKLYGVTTGHLTTDQLLNQESQRAAANGRTATQINQSLTVGFNQVMQGAQQALSAMGDLVKDHPVITGVGAAGLMAATAVCPFLAGLGAGALGVGLGQQMLSQASNAQPSQQPTPA